MNALDTACFELWEMMMTLEERYDALEAKVRALEARESITVELALHLIDGRIATRLETRNYVSGKDATQLIEDRLNSEFKYRDFVTRQNAHEFIDERLALGIKNQGNETAIDVRDQVDNHVKAWAKKMSAWVGISSLIVLATCIFYVFGYLPKQAASLALESSDELRQEMRQLTKDIAVQESILSQASNSVKKVQLETDNESQKISRLSEMLVDREEGLRVDLQKLEERLSSSAQAIDVQLGTQKDKLAEINSNIATLGAAVEQFRGNEGEILLDRINQFAKTLVKSDAISRLISAEGRLGSLESGFFTEIKCHSLSVVSKADKRSELLTLQEDSSGAGHIMTYDSNGKTMVAAGSSPAGNGYFAAFGPSSPSNSKVTPPVIISVDSSGAGGIALNTLDQKKLCYLGQSVSGGGRVVLHAKDEEQEAGRGAAEFFVDEFGIGTIMLNNSDDEALCVIGATPNATGGIILRNPKSEEFHANEPVSIFVGKQGQGVVLLSNGAGDNTCFMGSNESGEGGVWVLGKDGARKSLTP